MKSRYQCFLVIYW